MKYYITFLVMLAVANEIGLRRMNWIIGILVLGVIFYYTVNTLWDECKEEKKE